MRRRLDAKPGRGWSHRLWRVFNTVDLINLLPRRLAWRVHGLGGGINLLHRLVACRGGGGRRRRPRLVHNSAELLQPPLMRAHSLLPDDILRLEIDHLPQPPLRLQLQMQSLDLLLVLVLCGGGASAEGGGMDLISASTHPSAGAPAPVRTQRIGRRWRWRPRAPASAARSRRWSPSARCQSRPRGGAKRLQSRPVQRARDGERVGVQSSPVQAGAERARDGERARDCWAARLQSSPVQAGAERARDGEAARLQSGPGESCPGGASATGGPVQTIGGASEPVQSCPAHGGSRWRRSGDRGARRSNGLRRREIRRGGMAMH